MSAIALGIYVDPLVPSPRAARWKWDHACHLFHDQHDLAALDAFAAAIGMRTSWRHDAPGFPHYDLHVRHRALAVAAGAVEVDRRHPIMLAMFQRRRAFLATTTRDRQ